MLGRMEKCGGGKSYDAEEPALALDRGVTEVPRSLQFGNPFRATYFVPIDLSNKENSNPLYLNTFVIFDAFCLNTTSVE